METEGPKPGPKKKFHLNFEERVKLLTLYVGVATVFVSLGAGRFLTPTKQRNFDIVMLVIVFIFSATSLALSRWPRIKLKFRIIWKDTFWGLYALCSKPCYDARWVEEWGLNYCHPNCKGPYHEQNVRFITVDDGKYKDLVVEPSHSLLHIQQIVFNEENGGGPLQLVNDGIGKRKWERYCERRPGLYQYVRKMIQSMHEASDIKFKAGEYRPQASSSWWDPTSSMSKQPGNDTTASSSNIVEIEGFGLDEFYQKTLDNFSMLLNSVEMSKRIAYHMGVAAEDGVVSNFFICPCGFSIHAGFAFFSIRNLSVLVLLGQFPTARVIVYDHVNDEPVSEKSYEMRLHEETMSALSLWACSPTGAIHSNVNIEGKTLNTHCYSLDESIEYCMEGRQVMLATINSSERFNVLAKG